jgi:hypothetical protein
MPTEKTPKWSPSLRLNIDGFIVDFEGIWAVFGYLLLAGIVGFLIFILTHLL